MFDFSPQTETEPEVVRDLRAARALLAPGFVKNNVRVQTAEGVRFCIGGAISQATNCSWGRWGGDRFYLVAEAIDREVTRRGYAGFVNYNNRPETTHADVLKLFDDAIATKFNAV